MFLNSQLINLTIAILQMKWQKLLSIIILIQCGCIEKQTSFPQKEYIIQAFDSIAHYSIHRNTFNFDSLEKDILLSVSDSTSIEEMYTKIERGMKVVDHHSYIIRKEKWIEMWRGESPEVLNNPYPFQGKLLYNKYAFVSLDGFSGGDSISANNYCDSLQKTISKLYAKNPIGWIIDLRYNNGGWSPAMISGLGPILGKGVKAYSISLIDSPLEHYYAKNNAEYIALTDSVWTFKKQLPIAILIGGGTASAGELLALAFRGNAKTLLIGNPTYGASTKLKAVLMPDSLQLTITNGIMTDRNKNGDGGKITPDIICNNTVEVFDKAYEWIESNQ